MTFNGAMILFPDTESELRAKLDELLKARPEPYAAGVSVTNRKLAGNGTAVVVNQGPESDFETVNTTMMRVNVYSADEWVARDLTRLVRALITGRGPGTVCNGGPFSFGALNAGPNPIDDGTDVFHWYMVFELKSRGSVLSPA